MNFLSSLNRKDLENKTCLLRVDFNIKDSELNKNNFRLCAVLPTIEFLVNNGAKIVILSHRGRPREKSKIKNQKSELQFKIKNYKKYSLKPAGEILSFLLKKQVYFIDFKKGFEAAQISKIIACNSRYSIFLLENLRFLAGEEENDKDFARQLASFGDIYINDAFAVSHRQNASVCAITKYLPSYAGLLLEKEIKNLSLVMKKPKKPLAVVLGGAKISDKIGVIKKFLKTADYFLIGGGMANTFWAAQGLPLGDSFYEKEMLSIAGKFLKSEKIILPVDTAIYKKQILDIGPKTIEKYLSIIRKAKTIIWNGPMGYIEDKKFKQGSEIIMKAILRSKAFTIIGGGETTSIIQNLKPESRNLNIFISTGGGAMLEYLAGKKLPGIEALIKINSKFKTQNAKSQFKIKN